MRIVSMVRPDDWHVHLRDGRVLKDTTLGTAANFARALVMPNLKPALTTVEAVNAYRQRILGVLAGNNTAFYPYMTLYLNEAVTPDELQRASQAPHILGAKFYPAGATTNSEAGASSLRALYPLLDVMQSLDLVLQIHGEVTHGDIFAREALFLETCLEPLIQDFPKLRIVLEHISTRAAVDFVLQAPKTVAATITPHHLLFNRNHLLAGGIKPHYYCLPILKQERDQRAIQQAAVSGSGKFFAGTDSAPHAQSDKESACGCAGIYSAPFALPAYAQVFDHLNQLTKLEAFMSRFGAEFYHLPVLEARIEVCRQPQTIPAFLSFGSDRVVPIAAGEVLEWSVYEAG